MPHPEKHDPTDDFKAFMQRREEVSRAYVNGDAGPLDAQATHTSPASIFGPRGDYVTGAREVNARNKRDAESFDQGSETHFEILHLEADEQLACWAGIQRSTVKLKGEKEAAPMDLRVTEIFRREKGEWKLVHRHADALAPDADQHR